MKKTLAPFFRFAMPFLQGSLVKQILVGLILGIALAYAWPSAAASVGILGTIFVNALKGVAPVLVFVLVLSSIANNSTVQSEGMHVKPILGLYAVSTFASAVIAVVASFLWPVEITLAAAEEGLQAPGGIADVITGLVLNVVDNPFRALVNANYIGILTWAIALGLILRRARQGTREMLADAADAVGLVVRVVIRFAPVGIFGLVSQTFATEGFGILGEYVQLLAVLLGAMAFTALVLNPALVWWCTHENHVSEGIGHFRVLHPVVGRQHPGQHRPLPPRERSGSDVLRDDPRGRHRQHGGGRHHDHGDHALGRALARDRDGRGDRGLLVRGRLHLRRGDLGRPGRLPHAHSLGLRAFRDRPDDRDAGRRRGLHHQRAPGLVRNGVEFLLRRALHDRGDAPSRAPEARAGAAREEHVTPLPRGRRLA